MGPHAAGHVSHAGLLDLDDLGAQVAKGAGGEGPGDGLGKLQDSNAFKGQTHSC